MLSELGERQCLELRGKLKEVIPTLGNVEAIIASPMRRTLQTAQLSMDWLLQDEKRRGARAKKLQIEANADWQGEKQM